MKSILKLYVVDDCLINIVESRLGELIAIAKGSLRKYRVPLESLEIKTSILYALLSIIDTLPAYTRMQVEHHGRRLREVRSELPLKWSL